MKRNDKLELFKAENTELNQKIKEAFVDTENEVEAILDGAFDSEKYFYNKGFKILWLMKEPYDDGGNGAWSLPELFTKDYNTFFSGLIMGSSGRTWQPVVYVSYGILNKFQNWDEIPFIKDDPSIVKVLENVAWINIQKLPSITGRSTNMSNIYSSYNKHKELIQNQVEVLNPDIIICGNTFDVVKEYFGNLQKTIYDMIEYYVAGKRLIINAYHPSQRQIKRERYVNNIVKCVENWSLKK